MYILLFEKPSKLNNHTFFLRELISFLRLKDTLSQGEMAKAIIQLKGMLVVYLVSLSRA